MRFVFNDKGSLTLEATLVFPVFLALMLFLINFLNVAAVYVAMDHAVSETVKEIAACTYPLKYLKSTPYIVDTGTKVIAQKKIKEYYPLGNITDKDFTISRIKTYNPENKSVGSSLADHNLAEHNQLNYEDIAITVKYKVNLPVPFFPLREVTLSNTAVERAWVDD